MTGLGGVRGRPGWLTITWWRQPLGAIYLSALVLSLGRGAWFTTSALFFTRSVGLSAHQFGVGITAAGLVGLIVGGPLGWLADRWGAQEMLISLGVMQGLAILLYGVVHGFWGIVTLTCVVMACERSIPSIRVAVVSTLATGEDRMPSIATTRSMTQGGIVVGAVFGGWVLASDHRSGYLALVVSYGIIAILCALLTLRTPRVVPERRQSGRTLLVLHDKPFLLLTGFNGLLALNWGMLESGVPLWITTHTRAAPWLVGVLMGLNAVAMVLLQRRVMRTGSTVLGAARLGLRSGVVLAVSCAIFPMSAHRAPGLATTVIVVAAIVHAAGELFFIGSGYGLSIGLTREHAHGEYQGTFATGQAAAMVVAPGLMTLLLVEWGVTGWFVLAALYLLGGVGTVLTGRHAAHSLPLGQRAPAAGVRSPSTGSVR